MTKKKTPKKKIITFVRTIQKLSLEKTVSIDDGQTWTFRTNSQKRI